VEPTIRWSHQAPPKLGFLTITLHGVIPEDDTVFRTLLRAGNVYLYSEGVRFESRQGHILIEAFLWFPSVPPYKNRDSTVQEPLLSNGSANKHVFTTAIA
jgi:hypothetical protein